MDLTSSDFFRNGVGGAAALDSLPQAIWRGMDRLYDLGVEKGGRLRELRRQAATGARRRVLIAAVEVPTRKADIHDVLRRLQQQSRHDISTSVVPMGDQGKFSNIDEAVSRAPPLHGFDWLIVTDDDIAFAPQFFDDLILLAEAAGLSLLQPAHAFCSHASYAVTRRRWASLVRQTDFVEIGPLTLIKADVFDRLLPFPASRWCYGIDLVWSEVLRRHGRSMGIVDGAPVRHLRPVAASYNIDQAIAEGERLLQQFDINRSRAEFLQGGRILIGTRA